MVTYKGYAFIKDGIVVSLHYYDSSLDTIALDEHPLIVSIPEQLFNVVLVGWQCINGEFTQ